MAAIFARSGHPAPRCARTCRFPRNTRDATQLPSVYSRVTNILTRAGRAGVGVHPWRRNGDEPRRQRRTRQAAFFSSSPPYLSPTFLRHYHSICIALWFFDRVQILFPFSRSRQPYFRATPRCMTFASSSPWRPPAMLPIATICRRQRKYFLFAPLPAFRHRFFLLALFICAYRLWTAVSS